MDNVNEQKCPTCGAPMRFDPKQGLLVCDYCGATVELGKPETATQGAELDGFDFDALNEQATDPNAEDLPVYNCVSCGAEVIAPAEQIALTCPYCRNNIVLTNKVTGKLRPDGVIPFRIESKQLPEALNRFYKDKKLLPKNFFSESTVGNVTGVYVPFWTFSGRLSGRLIYDGQRSSSHRSGDYVITDTKHYKLLRDVSVDFADLPVDASDRIDDALMDSLEPFEMQDVKPFDMRYLAGFTADRFDRAAQDIAPRAERRMRTTAQNQASVRVGSGYSGVRLSGGGLHADLKARYLLFPVYLFDISHGGKTYSFALNGQTGKVVGDLPIDKGVSRTYFLVRAGAVLGAALLLSLAKYMLGW